MCASPGRTQPAPWGSRGQGQGHTEPDSKTGFLQSNVVGPRSPRSCAPEPLSFSSSQFGDVKYIHVLVKEISRTISSCQWVLLKGCPFPVFFRRGTIFEGLFRELALVWPLFPSQSAFLLAPFFTPSILLFLLHKFALSAKP